MLTDTPMELSKKWRLCPASHRTLLVFSEALIYLSYTAVVARLRVMENLAERQGLEPRTPLLVRLFSRQRPRPTGRAPLFAKWLPDVDSHHDVPFNRRACCFDITGEWSLRAVSRRGRPLIGRMLCY
jgi:hypothetical protein